MLETMMPQQGRKSGWHPVRILRKVNGGLVVRRKLQAFHCIGEGGDLSARRSEAPQAKPIADRLLWLVRFWLNACSQNVAGVVAASKGSDRRLGLAVDSAFVVKPTADRRAPDVEVVDHRRAARMRRSRLCSLHRARRRRKGQRHCRRQKDRQRHRKGRALPMRAPTSWARLSPSMTSNQPLRFQN